MNATTPSSMKTFAVSILVIGSLCCAARAQTVIHSFEYQTDDELLAEWVPSANATLSVSDETAARAPGSKSMRVEFNFPSTAWTTETVRGPGLESLLSIAPEQYLTFRLRGDPAFATADFRNIYLYAYDDSGYFGRWGTQVPITSDWQVMNFVASTIQQPWDSTGLPDLSRIVQFAFYQYGSEAAIEPYTATVYIDDLTVRDSPLVEFDPPSAPRALIDDFEGYADDAALRKAYSYQNSPAATQTTASLETPAPQGNKALQLDIAFAPGQWPWGSVRSGLVPAFSFPGNGVASLQIRGDPTLAELADAGTTFWLSFYDKAGRGMNFSTPAAPVISSEWTRLEARLADFNNTTTVDVGNLVQWRILVEGWQGTAESAARTGTFYVDDIRITLEAAELPTLAVVRTGATWTLQMTHLAPGTTYQVRTSPNFTQWSTAHTIQATSDSAAWVIPMTETQAFYQLVEQSAP